MDCAEYKSGDCTGGGFFTDKPRRLCHAHSNITDTHTHTHVRIPLGEQHNRHCSYQPAFTEPRLTDCLASLECSSYLRQEGLLFLGEIHCGGCKYFPSGRPLMLRCMGDSKRRAGDAVTMWIPIPSMTRPQRLVLYGTCALALFNSVGLLMLLIQQNQQHVLLEQAGDRLTQVEQSSVVEFLQEVPRERAQRNVGKPQFQYSRNKRSDALELDEEQEKTLEVTQEKEIGTDEEQEVEREVEKELDRQEDVETEQQEVSLEVGEETEMKPKHNRKHKHRHNHRYHKQDVHDDMMMMLTYSMVPVR